MLVPFGVDGEPAVADDLVGAVGLADHRVVLVDLPGGDGVAERHHADHERQPHGDGGLPVAGAPVADTACQVAGAGRLRGAVVLDARAEHGAGYSW